MVFSIVPFASSAVEKQMWDSVSTSLDTNGEVT